MKTNPENSSFDAQNNNKSAPKCFCCKCSSQGLQKHQNLKFDLLTIFLRLKFQLPKSQNSPMRLVPGFVGAGHICIYKVTLLGQCGHVNSHSVTDFSVLISKARQIIPY